MSSEISLRSGLRAGDLGRIIELHGKAYDALPGYGLTFEAYVARTIAEYILDNRANGCIWLAERDDQLIGCTAIVLRDEHLAQLRWVLVDESARGLGLGGQLVDAALEYCRAKGCQSIVLDTTDGLPESRALYEKLGFRVTSDETQELWNGLRRLLQMQLDLDTNC